MNWRDFFYFSNGERRALALLHCLLLGAWGYLFYLQSSQEEPAPVPVEENIPDAAPAPAPSSEKDSQALPTSAATAPAPVRTLPPQTARAERIRKRVYPARTAYPRLEKYPAGTVVELNRADTLSLKRIPGIGSTFARRIVRYRDLLGGYCRVEQLREVYGIDEEKYAALKGWFSVDTALVRPISVNRLSAGDPLWHVYLNDGQIRALRRLLRQKGRIDGWESLRLLEEFSDEDRTRLLPYLSFE